MSSSNSRVFHSFLIRISRAAISKVQSLIYIFTNYVFQMRITRLFITYIKPTVNTDETLTSYDVFQVPEKWLQVQEGIQKKVIAIDTEEWQKSRNFAQNGNLFNENELKYIAGVDISYAKEGKTACAAVVVCEMPELNVIYQHCQLKEITVPYVAGFLTFREVLPFLEVMRHLLIEAPHFKPQVILVDGNGLLHPREAGLACHLGVLADVPCIGVAKNFLKMNNLIDFDANSFIGDDVPLVSKDGRTLGMAVKTGKAFKPVFVSVGHKISLDTATWLVKLCSKYRVPEPIRQADIRSRQFLERHPDLKKSSRPTEI